MSHFTEWESFYYDVGFRHNKVGSCRQNIVRSIFNVAATVNILTSVAFFECLLISLYLNVILDVPKESFDLIGSLDEVKGRGAHVNR